MIIGCIKPLILRNNKLLTVVYMNVMKTILSLTKQSETIGILISISNTNIYQTKPMSVIVIVQIMKILLVYPYGLMKEQKIIVIVV